MVTLWPQDIDTFHTKVADVKFNLAEGEGVAYVKASICVGESDCSKELWELLSQLGGGDGMERDVGSRRCISIEKTQLLPLLLIFLLEGDKRVSLLGASKLQSDRGHKKVGME